MLTSQEFQLLSERWFWLADNESLSRFEGEPFAQGYELLRRHPSYHLPCQRHVLIPNLFRKPWPTLSRHEQEAFRSLYDTPMFRLGLIYEPPIWGKDWLLFRCDQPSAFLYDSLQAIIESSRRAVDQFALQSESIAENIKLNGQTLPIRLFEGKILDGRNRYLACEVAGIEPWFQEYQGDDPLAHTVCLNLTGRVQPRMERTLRPPQATARQAA